MPDPVRADLAVILAAGGGTRLGGPKGLLRWRGRPLLLHHVDALQPFATEVIAVVGAALAAHRALDPELPLVHNPDWATSWPADSLRLALRARPLAETVLVTPVDTPPCPASTARALLGVQPPAVPVGPTGRDGHPVLLGPALTRALRDQAPDGGLRAVLTDAQRVSVDQADVALDFDTARDWADWQALREGPESG